MISRSRLGIRDAISIQFRLSYFWVKCKVNTTVNTNSLYSKTNNHKNIGKMSKRQNTHVYVLLIESVLVLCFHTYSIIRHMIIKSLVITPIHSRRDTTRVLKNIYKSKILKRQRNCKIETSII